MSDDLTQPPNSGPPASGGFDANHPTIISLCYLGGWVTGGLTAIVGIVLAYVWKDEAQEWEHSHYTYLIRTFWIGLVASVVAFILWIVLIGFLLSMLVGVWFVVRSILSLVKAQKREPMPDPETLLF
ncbi:MAG: hypothetical protein H6920_01505 [Sphingomonadaceae bacterium]|nr:hypothetical protein [Sphingomonadaceae bacterium]MCP5390292.1 hypothetical protein [Sphingomonadaceae bacterium]MCP5392376.1 hypothetical protein [Sphingomonadaceae bacterium]